MWFVFWLIGFLIGLIIGFVVRHQRIRKNSKSSLVIVHDIGEDPYIFLELNKEDAQVLSKLSTIELRVDRRKASNA